jgi:hypothetical protein
VCIEKLETIAGNDAQFGLQTPVTADQLPYEQVVDNEPDFVYVEVQSKSQLAE